MLDQHAVLSHLILTVNTKAAETKQSLVCLDSPYCNASLGTSPLALQHIQLGAAQNNTLGAGFRV